MPVVQNTSLAACFVVCGYLSYLSFTSPNPPPKTPYAKDRLGRTMSNLSVRRNLLGCLMLPHCSDPFSRPRLDDMHGPRPPEPGSFLLELLHHIIHCPHVRCCSNSSLGLCSTWGELYLPARETDQARQNWNVSICATPFLCTPVLYDKCDMPVHDATGWRGGLRPSLSACQCSMAQLYWRNSNIINCTC